MTVTGRRAGPYTAISGTPSSAASSPASPSSPPWMPAPTGAGGLRGSPRTYRTLVLGFLATMLLQYLVPIRPPGFLTNGGGAEGGGRGGGSGGEGPALRGVVSSAALDLSSMPVPVAVREGEGEGKDGAEWHRGEFRGHTWKTNETVSVQRVVTTPFGVCELHRVRAPPKNTNSPDDTQEEVLSDWLWFDEKDQVNILAHLAPTQLHPEGGFLLFRTRKYGLQGQSLSPIGGLMEAGEEALEAAQRELLEEARLVSSSWVPLGRYRISSTRGGGHLHPFLAQHCTTAATKAQSDDMEQQERFILSESQLRWALMGNMFKEAKWTQTIAQALLYLQQPDLNKAPDPSLPTLQD